MPDTPEPKFKAGERVIVADTESKHFHGKAGVVLFVMPEQRYEVLLDIIQNTRSFTEVQLEAEPKPVPPV